MTASFWKKRREHQWEVFDKILIDRMFYAIICA